MTENTGPPTFEIPEADCQKCGKVWNPNSEQPRVCPACKNREWWIGEDSPYPQDDEPPEFELPEAECKKCGNEWHPLVESPNVCPECKNPKWWKGPKEFTPDRDN